MATFWQILVPASVVAVVSGWLSSTIEVISQYGAFGWWTVGLAAFGFTTSALYLAALTREKWIYAGIARERAKAGDAINPLEKEFHRHRIRLSDMVRPSTNYIRDKSFTDCQLIGPMTVNLDGCDITQAGFINCNWLVCKDDAKIFNAITMKNIVIRGGDMSDLTIVVPASQLDFLRSLPAVPMNLTGDVEIDARKHVFNQRLRQQ